MLGAEIRKARAKAGLTQEQSAALDLKVYDKGIFSGNPETAESNELDKLLAPAPETQNQSIRRFLPGGTK